MKISRILFSAGVLTLAAISASSNGQTLTVIHSFCSVTNNNFSCIDGDFPMCLIVGADGNLFGVANGGGTNGAGTAFKMTTAGTITVLHTFCNSVSCPNSLGSPNGMIQGSDNNFYGTAGTGGAHDAGGIFKLTSQGTFTTLYSFCATTNDNGFCQDGNTPKANLVEGSDGNFYGNTSLGGTDEEGILFRISSTGVFTNLFSLPVTFSIQPNTALIQGSDSNFYGIIHSGGNSGDGIIYQLTEAGTYTIIYNFCNSTNSCFDGNGPDAPLLEFGGNLLGTTTAGGVLSGGGTVFSVPLGGTNDGAATRLFAFCNSCETGNFPTAQLLLGSDTNFYGTTSQGGAGGHGTVFQLTPEGTLTTLHAFCTVTNGGNGCVDGMLESGGREAPLVQGHDGNFYGVTQEGGTKGNGVVFKIDMGLGGIGGSCAFSINPTNAPFAAAGGSATVSVTTSDSCPWTAVSNDSFITITSGDSGSGNGTVHYSVAANTNSSEQVGTMTIADETFTVTEAAAAAGGCTFTVSPTTITLTSKGGSKSVSVKTKGAGCAWTAVSNDPFITITGGSNGTASGKVTFTVAGNTNETALSGTMTIAGETVTVNQAVGGCTFKLSPKSAKFKSTGGVKTVKVTPNLADCTWTAFSNSGFITITGGASGVGKGVVSYTVSTNSTTNTLTGTMTIAGQTYTVTEAGVK
jgi:uncharacterized repeat protein (TIGR03803 family)